MAASSVLFPLLHKLLFLSLSTSPFSIFQIALLPTQHSWPPSNLKPSIQPQPRVFTVSTRRHEINSLNITRWSIEHIINYKKMTRKLHLPWYKKLAAENADCFIKLWNSFIISPNTNHNLKSQTFILELHSVSVMLLHVYEKGTESKRVEMEKKSWVEKTHHHFVFGTWFSGSSFWPSVSPTVLAPTLLPRIPPYLPLNLSEALITDEGWCATGSSLAIQLPVCASRWPRCCSDKKQRGERWEVREKEKQEKESKKEEFDFG